MDNLKPWDWPWVGNSSRVLALAHSPCDCPSHQIPKPTDSTRLMPHQTGSESQPPPRSVVSPGGLSNRQPLPSLAFAPLTSSMMKKMHFGGKGNKMGNKVATLSRPYFILVNLSEKITWQKSKQAARSGAGSACWVVRAAPLWAATANAESALQREGVTHPWLCSSPSHPPTCLYLLDS